MSDASQPLIDKALAKLQVAEEEVAKLKAFINQVLEFDGREPMFANVRGPASSPKSQQLRIGPDTFFGKPLATAAREILSMRKDAGMTAPATTDEIYDALTAGGFQFPSNDPERQKMGVAVSLAKNTQTFRKLPNGLYGLADWYANGKPPQRRKRAIILDDPADNVSEPDEDEASEISLASGSEASVSTPYSADEDGREVEHDNMNH